MSEDNNIREYVADGIEECDNPLPNWWIGLFVATILFAVGYMVSLYVLDNPDQIDKFNASVEKRQELMAKQEQEMAQGSSQDSSEDQVAQAKTAFQTNCLPCHGANGEGGIGANLTDDYWIHGGSKKDIAKIISEGVLTKGMPPWKDVLGAKKINQISDLIVSWRGKNLPGKAKEGDLYRTP